MLFPAACRNRSHVARTLVLAGVATSLLAGSAWGEERKFSVMLALPSKTVRQSYNYQQFLTTLPNFDDIRVHYHDLHANPDVDSFAEYWWEISYGTVAVSGGVFDWVEIPWPILPTTAVEPGSATIDPLATSGSLDGYYLPYNDLNSSGTFNQFQGEYLEQGRALINIDWNGELAGTGSPPQPYTYPVAPFGQAASPTYATSGFVDFDVITQRAVWTPGERYRDIDGDGFYDALVEPWRDGWGEEDTGGGGGDTGACCVGINCTPDTTEADCLGQLGNWHAGATCEDDDSNGIPDACEGGDGRAGRGCPGDAADGEVDDGEYADIDDDGEWDFPEPFEDYLRIFVPEGFAGGSIWVKLDPSFKNEDETSRAWAEAYIRANYPGFVGEPLRARGDDTASGFLARFGNDRFDPPDWWLESSGTGAKVQLDPIVPYLDFAMTPHPSDGYPPQGQYAWDFDLWWENYWNEKHIMHGQDPGPTAPTPQWDERIPRLVEFDPNEAVTQRIATWYFEPNCGGDTARALQIRAEGDPTHPDDAPIPEHLDPTLATSDVYPVANESHGLEEIEEGCGDGDLPIAAWSPGDGSLEDTPSGQILPDELDRNEDGFKDWYDGPAEFDDLPSSMYHARSISGLFYGGDGRLGEVTSPSNTAIYGQDIGAHDPNNPGGPDTIIPAGGPLAYNVHGTNGFDAGNVLNLEFLTWAHNPLTAATSVEYKGVEGGKSVLYGADTIWNRLVTIKLGPAAPTADVEWTSAAANFWDRTEPLWQGVKMKAVARDDTPQFYELFGLCARTRIVAGFPFEESYVVGINVPGGAADPLFVNPQTGQLAPIKYTDGTEWFDMYAPIVDAAWDSQNSAIWVLTDFYGLCELWAIDPNDHSGPDGSPVAYYFFPVGYSFFGCQGLAYAGEDGLGDPILYTKDLAWETIAQIDFVNFGELIPLSLEEFTFDVRSLTFIPGDPLTSPRVAGTDFTDNIFRGDLGARPNFWGQLGFSRLFARALPRDYNLDGLLDQGEVRAAGTENYVIDPYVDTVNDGGPNGAYPFNRQRLTEDLVAALDPSVDWDDYTMVVGDRATVHSTFFVPAGLIADGLAAGGRGLFQLPAPGMDLPIQVREQSGNALSPLYFSDFGTMLDGTGEGGGSNVGYHKQLMSHEWLHVWENYPDLYDYDEYSPGGVINHPVGAWDIMSGGWVHPCPPLKQWGQGVPGVGTAHLPWIAVRDLTQAINPREETPITLPDYAFVPTNSVYVFKNPNAQVDPPWGPDYDPLDTHLDGELYYFWRVTNRVYPYPSWVNFQRNGPGHGVLVMHTDFGSNPEGIPLQQRIGTHFTFNIVQADGLQQLETGANYGDAGDPFPGSQNVRVWNDNTDPSANWWNHTLSNLEIRDITQQLDKSIVKFYWNWRTVPELVWNRPVGSTVIPPAPNQTERWLVAGFEAFDFHAGTDIKFYADSDPDNGRYDIPVSQSLGFVEKWPAGVARLTAYVNIADLDDGEYYFYARLFPGQGNDGMYESWFSPPRADVANHGRGLVLDDLDQPGIRVLENPVDGYPDSKLERWIFTCVDHTTPGAERWQVEGSLSGVQPDLATTGQYYELTPEAGAIGFKIVYDPAATTQVSPDTTLTYNAADNYTVLSDPGAHFVARTFKPGDHVRIIGGPGALPGFYTIKKVPNTTTIQLTGNAGTATGGVTYMLHAFSTNHAADAKPDRFHIFTTGKTAYSLPVRLLNGEVDPSIFADLQVSYPDDNTNPQRRAPLLVRFDASGTLDENGQPSSQIQYHWDFGDPDSNTPTSTLKVAEHTYAIDQFPGPDPTTVTVTLTVRKYAGTPDELVDVETIDIVIGPPFFDADGDNIEDSVDNCPDTFNPDQADDDSDTVGNLCDNCPSTPNADQADLDLDGLGDVCDPDIDGDGVLNAADNCPTVSNADQADLNGDGEGDACDDDIDGDGILNGIDNCPLVPNDQQLDDDDDGLGNACDACPLDPDNDADGDGICGNVDNCPSTPNPTQLDADGDNRGDVCDPCPLDADNDIDNDGRCGNVDNCPTIANPDQSDRDFDGIGDLCDICPDDPGNDANSNGICDNLESGDDDDDDDDTGGDEPPPVLTPPDVPSLPFPDHGASAIATTTALDWADASRATMYRVIVGADAQLTTRFLDAGAPNSQWTGSLNLRGGTTYFWKVIARNTAGDTEGPVWSFTTAGTAPPASDDSQQEQPDDQTDDTDGTDGTDDVNDAIESTGLCPAASGTLLLFTLLSLWRTRVNSRRR